MDGKRQRHRRIQMRPRHPRRDITPHRHRQSPRKIDRDVGARGLAAQHDLRDHADPEDNQDEGAEEFGERLEQQSP